MEKVKFFEASSRGVSGPTAPMDEQVNKWLEEMGDKIEIVDRQFAGTSTFGLLIFYKTK